MQWKLTHRHNHECIENKGGKTLSYDPNLGIQIIEQDGFAFKDLDNNGRLDPYEDWRLPLTQRIQDFTSRFVLWPVSYTHLDVYKRQGQRRTAG